MLNPENIQRISDLLSLANQVGGAVNISIVVPLEMPPQEEPATAPGGVPRETATMRTVMWALNLLKGAPGQPNRNLVRRFLFTKGWIGGAEENESWQLEHVPTTKAELASIWSQVREFEKTLPKPKV